MRRLGELALASGFSVLFGLGIGLLHLTRGDTEAAVPPPSARPVAVAPAPVEEPAPHLARASAARESPAAAVAPRVRSVVSDRPPELTASAPTGFKPDYKRDANGNLMPVIPVQELRKLLPATDASMKACVERMGQGVTGKAVLSFTVIAKDGKLTVETTGVQDEETLASSPELLDCMHRTASALTFEGRTIPELGSSMYVRRSVRLENGALADNSIINFSYRP
jgi:hypothetical protein